MHNDNLASGNGGLLHFIQKKLEPVEQELSLFHKTKIH